MKDMLAIKELKNLLLSEDRSTIDVRFDSFKQEMMMAINKVEQEITDPDKLSMHLAKNKLALVDILSPMLGSMIKKYVESEMSKINNRIKNSTGITGILGPIKNLFSFGRRNVVRNFHHLGFPEIVEILLVEKDSGLLLGKYSRDEVLDADVIAGMFSAIKSFAETAFEASQNELELVRYQDYKIKIQAYGSIYFALVFRGRDDEAFDEIVTIDMNNFIDKYYETHILNRDNLTVTQDMSDLLNQEFMKTCKNLDQKLS